MKELEEEFTGLYRGLSSEIRNLEGVLEREGVSALDALKGVREKLRSFRSRMIEARIELRALLREARLGLKPDEVEELTEEVEDFFDRWRGMLEDLLEEVRDLARSAERVKKRVVVFTDVGRVIEQSLEQTAKGLERALSRLKEALEREFEGPSYVVSARLPQRDLEIIDALVEAGIFKSRSEALSFFAHKGIESSKQPFQEALTKLEELRALREKLREELRRAFEESQRSSG